MDKVRSKAGRSDVNGMVGVPRSVAAVRLGVSRQRVHQLVRSGELSEIDVCGTGMISVGSLSALLWTRGMVHHGK